MTADTITAIKKALEGVTPDRVERLWWLLHIMSQSSGTADASVHKWNWINAFCHDYEDDTFNLAKKLGFIRVTHDTDMDASYAAMTDAGNVLIAYFDKAPSAAANTDLESLQRENEELKNLIDGDNCADPDKIDVLFRRAEAEEAEVKRLREALKPFSKMAGALPNTCGPNHEPIQDDEPVNISCAGFSLDGITAADLNRAYEVSTLSAQAQDVAVNEKAEHFRTAMLEVENRIRSLRLKELLPGQSANETAIFLSEIADVLKNARDKFSFSLPAAPAAKQGEAE